MSLIVGSTLTQFYCSAVLPDNTITDSFDILSYFKHKIGVIFFYPLDFTFVCPSELIALDNATEDFTKRNAAVVSISIDSQYTHLAYKNTAHDQGGIGKVKFPMLADINKNLASSFNVLNAAGIALRATIIVDRHGIIRHHSVNDLPIGRNIDEILRIIDAIEHHSVYGEVCPANWSQGKLAMKATQSGVISYLKEIAVK